MTQFDWYSTWVDQHLGLTVTLVRNGDLDISDLFTAFEVDSSTIAECTFDEADDIMDVHRVRVGLRNDWWFTIEHFSLVGASDEVLNRLSMNGGEAHSIAHTMTLSGFQSSHDGRRTCQFDLGMPEYRYGAEPDRYLEQIKQAGLTYRDRDQSAGGARLLQLVTGVELDADMLEASLPSAVLTRTFFA